MINSPIFSSSDLGDALAGQTDGIGVQAAIGLVEDRELGLQHGQIQNLGAFHFTAGTLTAQVRGINSHEQVTVIAKQLRQFWLKVELRGGDKVKIQEGLLRLLRLLVENVGEMVEDEEWLHGQILTLREIISNPIDKNVIADAAAPIPVSNSVGAAGSGPIASSAAWSITANGVVTSAFGFYLDTASSALGDERQIRVHLERLCESVSESKRNQSTSRMEFWTRHADLAPKPSTYAR